eukprot:NODE_402_length_9320_cov_0.440252.p6 type:complete len:182 gc:universal NODE_402_length_9320_cov_0.440252:8539-9084(+)
MDSNFKCRTANIHDAEAIRDIYSPAICGSATSFEVEIPSIAEMQNRIREILNTLPWLVCEHDGIVIGYSYASPHHHRKAYQYSVDAAIYIHKDWQSKGVGKLLLTKLFDCLKTLGYYNVYAGITIPNPASLALHKRMGMEVVGTYKKIGYKYEKWHDVLWLHGTLQEHTVPPKSIQKFEVS